MLLVYMITLLMLWSSVEISAHHKKYRRKNGKLKLVPAELVDLVEKEKNKVVSNPETRWSNVIFDKNTKDTFGDFATTTEQECNDEESLKTRKVWSRWSKWSDCSVTCGGGTIVRSRMCVAGRCAPGEREEQHRPCTRAPCQCTLIESGNEDLHDSE